jgi:HCOMODA/2-hydroxy-3-carboxy-muconic semialdehyde decarboxylase
MDSQVLSDLVVANHILVNEGVLDGFGHISVRDPSNPERFFIARSMAPASHTGDIDIGTREPEAAAG